MIQFLYFRRNEWWRRFSFLGVLRVRGKGGTQAEELFVNDRFSLSPHRRASGVAAAFFTGISSVQGASGIPNS